MMSKFSKMLDKREIERWPGLYAPKGLRKKFKVVAAIRDEKENELLVKLITGFVKGSIAETVKTALKGD